MAKPSPFLTLLVSNEALAKYLIGSCSFLMLAAGATGLAQRAHVTTAETSRTTLYSSQVEDVSEPEYFEAYDENDGGDGVPDGDGGGGDDGPVKPSPPKGPLPAPGN